MVNRSRPDVRHSEACTLLGCYRPVHVKTPNLCPGESPRHFFDSDREILPVFYDDVPLRRPRPMVVFLFVCFCA